MVKKIRTCVACGKSETDSDNENEEEIKEILKKYHIDESLDVSLDSDILQYASQKGNPNDDPLLYFAINN
tara:strand:- start:4944 stop:5153 length:210 start_codon:yes stop_codon:yes gene_type:complete